jgi:hypothetical protein
MRIGFLTGPAKLRLEADCYLAIYDVKDCHTCGVLSSLMSKYCNHVGSLTVLGGGVLECH